MTWNEHIRYQAEALEFMGLPVPPARLAFDFVEAPPAKRLRCRAPHPAPAPSPSRTPVRARAHPEAPAGKPQRPYSLFARRALSAEERAYKRESDRILRESEHLRPLDPPDDCRPGMPRGLRPCPWVRCRFSLVLTVNESGSIKVDHGHLDGERLADTCAIDVAERHREGISQEAAARLVGVTEDRVRQVERALRERLMRKMGKLRRTIVEDDGDEEGEKY